MQLGTLTITPKPPRNHARFRRLSQTGKTASVMSQSHILHRYHTSSSRLNKWFFGRPTRLWGTIPFPNSGCNLLLVGSAMNDKDKDDTRKGPSTAQFPITRLIFSQFTIIQFSTATSDVKSAYFQGGWISRDVYMWPRKRMDEVSFHCLETEELCEWVSLIGSNMAFIPPRLDGFHEPFAGIWTAVVNHTTSRKRQHTPSNRQGCRILLNYWGAQKQWRFPCRDGVNV